MASVADAIRVLEDMLSQHHYPKAVQLLRTIRKQWKGEGEFGSMEEDDVDCLFFIYARYVCDRQEGAYVWDKRGEKEGSGYSGGGKEGEERERV